MKKITFLFTVLSATLFVEAQQTSFETSEGYTTGELVHTVSGWEETTVDSNYFYVSNDKASDGENSLKLLYDPNHPQVFANLTFPQALPVEDNLEISFDVYLPGDMTTLYWKIMSNDTYAAYIIIQESFVFPAKVTVVNPVPIAMASINVGEFNEIKLVFNYTEETITYYANGVEIYQGEIWGSNEAIDAYEFEGFLEQDTYFDNLKTNGVLSVGNFQEAPFTHFIQNDNLNLESPVSMEYLEIYDTLGKLVLSAELGSPKESVSISALNSGMYVARLKQNKHWQSFKFVK